MKEKKIEINRHGEILGTPPEVYAHENNKNEIDHGNVDKGDRKCETGNETNRNGFNKNSYTDSMDKKNNTGENVDMSGKKSHLYHNNAKNDELEQNIEKVNEDIHRTYYKNEYGGEAIDDSEDVHKHTVRKKNEIDFERFNANVDMYSEYDALSIYKNSKYKENDQKDTDIQKKTNFDGKNSSNKMYQHTPIIDSNDDASRFQNITNGQYNTDMHEKAYNISNHPHIRYGDNSYDTNHANLNHSNRAYDHTNDKNRDYDNSGLQQNISYNNGNLNNRYSNSNIKVDGYGNEEQIGKSGRANDYKNPAMTRQDSSEYTGAKSSSNRRENTDYNANNVNRGAYDDTSQVSNAINANYDKSVYDQTEMDDTQYNLTDFNSNGYNNGEYKNIPYNNTEYSNNEYDNTQFHNNDYAKPFNQAYNSASNFDNLRVKTSKYNEPYDTTGQFNTYNPHYSANSYNSQYPDRDPKNYEIQMFDKTQQAYDAENPYMYSYYDKGDQPLYVNVKQFTCIRKRKMRRDFLDTLMKQQSSGYLHESRHRHAMNRMRAPSGRFLTKEETAKMKKNQNDEHHEM